MQVTKLYHPQIVLHTTFETVNTDMAWQENPYSRQEGATIRTAEDGRTLRHIPLGDIILYTELRVATEHNLRTFRCPCRDCKGGCEKTIRVIRRHHADVGRDPFLEKSLLGGDPPEGYPPQGLWIEDVAYDNDVIQNANSDVARDIDNIGLDEDNLQQPGMDNNPPLDQFHEVHRQVMEALDRGDALHEESQGAADFVDPLDGVNDNVDGLEDLYQQATTPLYPMSRTSVVSATIIIMNMCTVFRVSNKFTDELFRYLSTDLLPRGNKLPGTHYEARKSIRKLGLNYNTVHACRNGCILFQEEHSTVDSCPECSSSRWMDGTKSILAKVIRHFPLIPRLKRMWRSSEIAQS